MVCVAGDRSIRMNSRAIYLSALTKRTANEISPANGSARFAQRQSERHRRLAPVVDLTSFGRRIRAFGCDGEICCLQNMRIDADFFRAVCVVGG